MAETNETYMTGTGQPAQGAVETYGEKYDIVYKSANNWRARRQSLAKDGTVQVGTNHWLVNACKDGISPEEGGPRPRPSHPPTPRASPRLCL